MKAGPHNQFQLTRGWPWSIRRSILQKFTAGGPPKIKKEKQSWQISLGQVDCIMSKPNYLAVLNLTQLCQLILADLFVLVEKAHSWKSLHLHLSGFLLEITGYRCIIINSPIAIIQSQSTVLEAIFVELWRLSVCIILFKKFARRGCGGA